MAAPFRNNEEWLAQVPEGMRTDPLWVFEAYRRALFLADLAWFDCDKMMNDTQGKIIARQLIGSAGSVAANIEEGYGRGYGKDYARFLRIAIGSAPETCGWYFRGRHILDETLTQHRLTLIDEIISSLVIAARKQKGNK